MRDYARLTPEQKAMYNEGLLDAIDRLTQSGRSASIGGDTLVAGAFRVAAADLQIFRIEQINSLPQGEKP